MTYTEETPGDVTGSALPVDVMVETRGEGGRGGALADSRQPEGGDVDFFRERLPFPSALGVMGLRRQLGDLTYGLAFCCNSKKQVN